MERGAANKCALENVSQHVGHEAPLALAPTSLPIAALPTVQGTLSKEREPRSGRIEMGSIVGGRYEIAEFVAEGAFGAVYRAHDIDVPGHVVALKLMHRPPASEAEHARCLREVQLIAAVSHPSVVSFKDHGVHRGRLYIVMPWYEGETLAERLRNRGALSRREALAIFKRLAEALAAMHERGIRHQDVKPENIILARFGAGQDDFPVLLDLGVGAFGDELLPAFTAAYVAPEMANAHLQLCAGEKPGVVDGKADVFSLALTLFDALAPGARVISADAASAEGLARRAQYGAELPKVATLSDVAPALARWLSVDPKKRPTARELVSELSVLTRAAERRAERRRLAMRLGPVLSLVIAVVAVLAVELRKERVSSRVKDQRIEQQAAEIDHAREAIGELSTRREREAEVARRRSERLAAQLAREQDLKVALQKGLEAEQQRTRELKRGLADAHERTLSLENELRTLDRELSESRAERDTLGQELSRLTVARKALQLAYEETRTEAEHLSEQVRQLQEERGRMLERIAELERSQSVLAAELARVREQLQRRPRQEALLHELSGERGLSDKPVL